MKAGDHIRILKDGAWHHAIDIGDRTVLHFERPEGVRRSRLDQLSSGAERVELVTHPERVYAPRMVVARAFSRLSESAYREMFADSEQFAIWCKSGQPRGNAGAPAPLAGPAAASAPAPRKPQPAARARPAPARTARPSTARPKAAAARKKPAGRAKPVARKGSSSKGTAKPGRAAGGSRAAAAKAKSVPRKAGPKGRKPARRPARRR